MSVSLLSINVRGLKNIVSKANCTFLQETLSGIADEKFWKQQWGDQKIFSHGTSHSAGVIMLLYRLPGKVIEHKSDTEGHWLMVVVEMHDQRFILLCVYGFVNRANNRAMLIKLGLLIN